MYSLDITFNLNNATYRPHKKPNDLLSYINKSSNHSPQVINQLPKTVNEPLSRSSSDAEVFNWSKHQCKKAVRDTGYTDFKLTFNQTSTKQTKRTWQCNIIWFNPPFIRAVSTNVAKRFLQGSCTSRIATLQQASQKFNRSTVKVSELLLHPKCSQHHQIT